MITIVGTKYLFGVCPDKPTLPEGWTYIENPREWLLCEDEHGRQYFVGAKDPESFGPDFVRASLAGSNPLQFAMLMRRRKANLWDVLRTLPNVFRGRRSFRLGDIFADDRDTIII